MGSPQGAEKNFLMKKNFFNGFQWKTHENLEKLTILMVFFKIFGACGAKKSFFNEIVFPMDFQKLQKKTFAIFFNEKSFF